MSFKTDCCFSGKGKIYVRPWVCLDAETTYNPNPLVHIGNVLSFSIEIQENSYSVPDRTSCAGGVECYASTIEGVDIKIEASCWDSLNLANGLYGTQFDIAAGSVVAEPHTSPSVVTGDWFVPLANIPDPATVVVTGFTAGIDYIVTPGGILFYGSSNGGTVPADTALTIDYDFTDQECIPMISGQPPELELWYDGENCVSQNPFRVQLCRVRFKPISEINFISGEEFSILNFEGSALKDPSKKADADNNPFSQYGKLNR